MEEKQTLAALAIANQEIKRVFARGIVPYTLDESDLRSEANEAIVVASERGYKAIRLCIRHRLLNLIKRQYVITHNQVEMPDQIKTRHDDDYLSLDPSQFEGILTAKQLEAVQLVYYQGLSVKQAAAQLHIATDAMEDRVRKALQKMKTVLEPCHEEHGKESDRLSPRTEEAGSKVFTFVSNRQKAEAIEAALLSNPTLSNVQIAKQVGVSTAAVRLHRQQLEEAGQLERVTVRVALDGKRYNVSNIGLGAN